MTHGYHLAINLIGTGYKTDRPKVKYTVGLRLSEKTKVIEVTLLLQSTALLLTNPLLQFTNTPDEKLKRNH